MATDGRKKYCQEQRQQTLSTIDEAIYYLRDNGLRITKSSIAREAGIHRNTLRQTYVEMHLLRTCPELQRDYTPVKETSVEELTETCETLSAALSTCQKQKSTLLNEYKALRSKYNELQTKYKRLLGEVQKMGEGKIVRL